MAAIGLGTAIESVPPSVDDTTIRRRRIDAVNRAARR
jgi:hypothetical protein